MYTYCLYCIHVCVWISIPLLSQTALGFEYIKSLLRWLKSRWWFQIFFIFTPTWGRFSIWLIFFKWVETTNQKWIFRCLAEAWFAGKKKASLREARHREGREWGYARLLFFPVLLLLSHLDRRTGSHLPSREIRKKKSKRSHEGFQSGIYARFLCLTHLGPFYANRPAFNDPRNMRLKAFLTGLSLYEKTMSLVWDLHFMSSWTGIYVALSFFF